LIEGEDFGEKLLFWSQMSFYYLHGQFAITGGALKKLKKRTDVTLLSTFSLRQNSSKELMRVSFHHQANEIIMERACHHLHKVSRLTRFHHYQLLLSFENN